MTGPRDESTTIAREQWWSTIRVLVIAPDEDGGWRVDVDVDDDRHPDENHTDVRFALVTTATCLQITLPVQILQELAERIGEL